MSLSPKLLSAWQKLLVLCKVQAGENLVVLVSDNSHPNHVIASKTAAQLLGAQITTLELGESPQAASRAAGGAGHGATNLTGNKVAIGAMKMADMIVDLMGLDRGTEQDEILASGTRILLVKEPPDIFLRLFPTEADRARVERAARKLGGAKSMHITSKAGTDLRVQLGEYKLLVQYGYVDEPGRWDHCPSSFVATWPNEKSSNGVVVLDPGTILLPMKEYVLTPVRLVIQDGYIKDISGGLDAQYLIDYYAKYNDPDAYAISHLGWGVHPNAHWTALAMYDKRASNGNEARSSRGNFMFSTGPNLEGGGKRNTACHLDIPMNGCSVLLDGDAVVAHGKVMDRE